MTIKILSNIPYLLELSGEYSLDDAKTTLKSFLEGLGVVWDEDALVVLNGKISKGDEILKDKDEINLLVPIAGG